MRAGVLTVVTTVMGILLATHTLPLAAIGATPILATLGGITAWLIIGTLGTAIYQSHTTPPTPLIVPDMSQCQISPPGPTENAAAIQKPMAPSMPPLTAPNNPPHSTATLVAQPKTPHSEADSLRTEDGKPDNLSSPP